MIISLHGEQVELLPDRALWWSRADVLLVADTHFGKAATFRAAAIPIPGGHTQEELARLERVIARTGARRLVVLGDLLHHRRGRDEETLGLVARWRATRPELDITLVRGNHDRGAGDPPDDWRVECVDAPYPMPPFTLLHEPATSDDGAYTLAGHVHPAVRLQGAGQTLKLPCFVFGERVGILPAFGGFSDGGVITPHEGDRVYAVADDRIVQVK